MLIKNKQKQNVNRLTFAVISPEVEGCFFLQKYLFTIFRIQGAKYAIFITHFHLILISSMILEKDLSGNYHMSDKNHLYHHISTKITLI